MKEERDLSFTAKIRGIAMKVFKNAKQAWRKLMNSTQEKLSRGASNINKIISWARGENWRGSQKDRHKRHEHKKN